MMNTQIERLKQLILQEKEQKGRSVVFWIDTDGEWNKQTLSHVLGDLAEVKILTSTNFLRIKLEVERQKSTQSFVLYSSDQLTQRDLEPLTSLQLAGTTFTHDDTIALAEQLHTDEWILRQLQQEYPKFFKTQTRVHKLERLMNQYPDYALNGLSLISVITGTKPDIIANLLNILTHGTIQEENKPIQTLQKLGLLDLFINLVQTELGVEVLQKETFLDQSITVIITSVFLRDGGEINKELLPFLSKKKNHLATLYEQLIQNPKSHDQWLQWTNEFMTRFKMESIVSDFPLKQLMRLNWFSIVDEIILKRISSDLMNQSEKQISNPWLPIITQRLQNDLMNYLSHIKRKYLFWLIIIELKTLLMQLKEKLIIPASTSDKLYQMYIADGYKLDEMFRKVSVLMEEIYDDTYQEVFKKLQVVYERDWLEEIAKQASTLISQSQMREEMRHQTDFFQSYVQNYVQKARQFVIISDAFRFEAGMELSSRLQFHPGCTVKCDAMLSSLPTYTQLGMSSLLPQIGPLTLNDNGTLSLGEMNTS
jgi:hypothetical protein